MTLPSTSASSQNQSAQQSQHFLLKWNNHRTNLINVFEHLLQHENLIDVTLAVEGKFLKAHKIVLSACSPYFQTMFVNQTPEDKHPILIFHDLKYNHMKTLLEFMYRGEISIDERDLSDVLKIAEALSIRGLSSFESDEEDSASDAPNSPAMSSANTNSNVNNSGPSTSSASSSSSTSTTNPINTSSSTNFHQNDYYNSSSSQTPPNINLGPSSSQQINSDNQKLHHQQQSKVTKSNNNCDSKVNTSTTSSSSLNLNGNKGQQQQQQQNNKNVKKVKNSKKNAVAGAGVGNIGNTNSSPSSSPLLPPPPPNIDPILLNKPTIINNNVTTLPSPPQIQTPESEVPVKKKRGRKPKLNKFADGTNVIYTSTGTATTNSVAITTTASTTTKVPKVLPKSKSQQTKSTPTQPQIRIPPPQLTSSSATTTTTTTMITPPSVSKPVRRRIPKRLSTSALASSQVKREKLSNDNNDGSDEFNNGLADLISSSSEPLSEMSVRGLDLFKYAAIEDGVYRCMECEKLQIPKTFKNKYSFQRHAFLYHEGNMRKVFPCPVCCREFSRPDKMKNHLRSIHEGGGAGNGNGNGNGNNTNSNGSAGGGKSNSSPTMNHSFTSTSTFGLGGSGMNEYCDY